MLQGQSEGQSGEELLSTLVPLQLMGRDQEIDMHPPEPECSRGDARAAHATPESWWCRHLACIMVDNAAKMAAPPKHQGTHPSENRYRVLMWRGASTRPLLCAPEKNQ